MRRRKKRKRSDTKGGNDRTETSKGNPMAHTAYRVAKFSAERMLSEFHPATETPAKTQEKTVVPVVEWILRMEKMEPAEASMLTSRVTLRPR